MDKKFIFCCFAILVFFSCKDDNEKGFDNPIDPSIPSWNEEESNLPNYSFDIPSYNGELASDASSDIVGTDNDIYWEANSFPNVLTITYNGESVDIDNPTTDILTYNDGSYVTVDFSTNEVIGVEIIVRGSSDNGGLKIYGQKKFKVSLDGVSLQSQKGPAINSQCKKRMFLHLTDGTVNQLSDASNYTQDAYYLDESTAEEEDRRATLFSEGNIIVSGTGSLQASSNAKNGIATDGYFWMRPGSTIAVLKAEKDALHVKGDEEEGIGIHIQGGYFYACVSSDAGKAFKSEQNVEIDGGTLLLNTTGSAIYDSEDNDTSSPCCIKSDKDVTIAGGDIQLKSTGKGGKGINCDGIFTQNSGSLFSYTEGTKYSYSNNLTSSPKSVKADGDITINGGYLTLYAVGKADGSEAFESKTSITINNGSLYIYAYDDAMNAKRNITINGGKVFALATNNDGIDSNGTLTITGGLVISSGTKTPEEGLDCDQNTFTITGGTIIGIGGATSTPTSSACTQHSVIISGVSLTQGSPFCIHDADGTPLLLLESPRTLNGATLLFSSPSLSTGSYTLSINGTIESNSEPWNGYYSDGTWNEAGSSTTQFTISSMVTTVGSSGGMSGPGGNGGPGMH